MLKGRQPSTKSGSRPRFPKGSHVGALCTVAYMHMCLGT